MPPVALGEDRTVSRLPLGSKTGNDLLYLPCIVFLVQRGTQDCFTVGADIDQPINETGDDVRSIKLPFDRSRVQISCFCHLRFDFYRVQFVRLHHCRFTVPRDSYFRRLAEVNTPGEFRRVNQRGHDSVLRDFQVSRGGARRDDAWTRMVMALIVAGGNHRNRRSHSTQEFVRHVVAAVVTRLGHIAQELHPIARVVLQQSALTIGIEIARQEDSRPANRVAGEYCCRSYSCWLTNRSCGVRVHRQSSSRTEPGGESLRYRCCHRIRERAD